MSAFQGSGETAENGRYRRVSDPVRLTKASRAGTLRAADDTGIMRGVPGILATPARFSVLAMDDRHEICFGQRSVRDHPVYEGALYGYRNGKMVQFAEGFWFHSA